MKLGQIFLAACIGTGVGLGVRKYFLPAESSLPAAGPVEEEAAAASSVVPSLPVPPAERSGPVNPVFPRELEVRGIARFGRRVSIQLSDGSRLTDRDVELRHVERNSVTICSGPHQSKGVCPGCRKYPLKPGVVPPSRSVAGGSSASSRETVKVANAGPTGAGDPGPTGYQGEAVIPHNGRVDASFTMGVGAGVK